MIFRAVKGLGFGWRAAYWVAVFKQGWNSREALSQCAALNVPKWLLGIR